MRLQAPTTLTAARLLVLALALPLAAAAQDYGAMIQQQMQAMNQNLARGEQQVQQMVQQRMQDPAVQQAWQRSTTYQHQGQTYHVDQSGQYHVRAANGWWYPLAPR